MINSYITLDEIVRSVLADQEKYTTHEYTRLLGLAYRGLRELTFDTLGHVKVEVLTILDSLRADLPDDYMDYTFVGVLGDNNRIEPLGIDRNIPASNSDNTGVTRPLDETASIYYPLFGIGGGQNNNGYYTPNIDIENNQMIFSSMNAGDLVYLEYLSNGRYDGSRSVVHPYAEEALISYVYWKSIVRKRNVGAGEKREAERIYYNEKRLARARTASFTKEELMQTIRKGYKQAPSL